MKKLAVILLALSASTMSCDFYAPYYMYVDNQTNDTVRITLLEESPYYSEIDLEVLPERKNLLYEEENDAMRNRCNYLIRVINKGEVNVSTSSGRTLKKAIWDVNNWLCKGSFKGGWTQTFVITEDDLE